VRGLKGSNDYLDGNIWHIDKSPNHRPQKIALLVAHRIVRDAMREQYVAGDLLPPEHAMLEKYEIGRGTLREALRLLEFEGVIALKPGPKGGPVLLTPDASNLASSLILLMELNKSPFRNIVEVRTGLEPIMSRLAAARISSDSLEELRITIEEMEENLDDQDIFFSSNQRFHDIIAWSSGNPLFGYIVESLLGIVNGNALGIGNPSSSRKSTLKAHKEIYGAIESRDGDLAEGSMRDHLNAYIEYAEKNYREVLDRVIPWDQTLNH
jgi:GntR family transcriptional regulator, transcriptional repressor for pyruvate dehydrogenase complex